MKKMKLAAALIAVAMAAGAQESESAEMVPDVMICGAISPVPQRDQFQWEVNAKLAEGYRIEGVLVHQMAIVCIELRMRESEPEEEEPLMLTEEETE